MVFIDDCNLGSALKDRLEQKKPGLVIVKAGTAFAKESHNQYLINPKEENDYEILFEELVKLEKIPKIPNVIIHLWNVTKKIHQGLDRESIEKAMEKGFFSLLNIARAIGNQGITEEIRLKVVTSNMQEVTGNELLCPEKAALLGPVKVIPLEYENISCDCIDIDFPGTPGQGIGKEDKLIHQLIEELESGSPDRLISYRGNYRWVQTVEPVRLEKPQGLASRLRDKVVYLITGGLGGMGLVLAEHLARSVKARLTLVGRSAFPLREEWDQWLSTHDKDDHVSLKIGKLQELENIGAGIMVVSADVADHRQMQEVIARAKKRFNQINGVIHTAGVIDYAGIIQRRTREVTEKILAPKITGTLILDSVLEEFELDFFILCSSIASIIPSFGEVGYVGANDFLDAFTHYKTARHGTYCVSINWCTWKEVGMAVNAAEQRAKKKKTTGSFDILKNGILSAEGIDIFNRVLENKFQQVIIYNNDLKNRYEQLKIPREKSKDSQPPKSTSAEPKYQRPDISTAYVAPDDEIEKKISGIWQNQLGIQKVGIHDNFFDLGADSLNIVQVKAVIKKVLKKDIPIVAMYTYPTISSLKEYLQEEKTSIGFSDEERERLNKKESKGRGKLKQRQKRVKSVQPGT